MSCALRVLSSVKNAISNFLTILLTSSTVCFAAGPKALVCDQCGAQFSKEDALEAHRQTHTGKRLLLLPSLHLPASSDHTVLRVSERPQLMLNDTPHSGRSSSFVRYGFIGADVYSAAVMMLYNSAEQQEERALRFQLAEGRTACCRAMPLGLWQGHISALHHCVSGCGMHRGRVRESTHRLSYPHL